MKNNTVIIIVIALVVGALGFFAGMQYQRGKGDSFRDRPFQTGGFQRGNGQGVTINRQGLRPVSGKITKIDGNTITLKTQDGGSKIVIFANSTNVNKTTEGSRADLKIGDQIMVIGSTNTDNTTTAQMISVGGGFMRGGSIDSGLQPGQK